MQTSKQCFFYILYLSIYIYYIFLILYIYKYTCVCICCVWTDLDRAISLSSNGSQKSNPGGPSSGAGGAFRWRPFGAPWVILFGADDQVMRIFTHARILVESGSSGYIYIYPKMFHSHIMSCPIKTSVNQWLFNYLFFPENSGSMSR